MNMQGYYQQPNIHKTQLVFVSEEELWTVSTKGGLARRLTSGRGSSKHPFFSPDGQSIAFSSTEDGSGDVYIIPSQGGIPRRLTHCGGCSVIGWTPQGNICFATNAFGPFIPSQKIYSISPQGGEAVPYPWGHGVHLSWGPKNRV